MKLKKYSLEQLKEAIKSSNSMRQVLQKLNVKAAGGNYQTLKKAINFFQLDISHFTGQLWNKGKKTSLKRPLEDYLTNTQTIQSYKLKNRLLRENVFPYECMCCGNSTWNKKPIPLELHHVDGNNHNNNLNNLQLLCPNCHAQTNNYRAKNK